MESAKIPSEGGFGGLHTGKQPRQERTQMGESSIMVLFD